MAIARMRATQMQYGGNMMGLGDPTYTPPIFNDPGHSDRNFIGNLAIWGGNLVRDIFTARNQPPNPYANMTPEQIRALQQAQANAANNNYNELGPVKPGHLRIFGTDISYGTLLVGGLAVVLLQSPGLTKRR